MGLAGDQSNQFEVGVVMQHGQVPSLRCRGDQGVDEGEGSLLAPGREGGLDFEGSSVVCIGGRHRWKGVEAVGDLPVVVRASGRVAELKGDRIAQGNLSARSQWRECRGHSGFGQPCENTGVDQISDACHLLVGAPRPFGGFEVEATILAEQGDEFEPPPGMDDFVQSGVDRRPQGSRAENRGSLSKDILVNLDGCLRHTSMISRRGTATQGCLRMCAPERRAPRRPNCRLEDTIDDAVLQLQFVEFAGAL